MEGLGVRFERCSQHLAVVAGPLLSFAQQAMPQEERRVSEVDKMRAPADATMWTFLCNVICTNALVWRFYILTSANEAVALW